MPTKIDWVIYFILIGLSLICIALYHTNYFYLGSLVCLWALFLLFRIIKLLFSSVSLSSNSLPQKLLQGLKKERNDYSKSIAKRLCSIDFLLWLGLIAIGFLWVLLCSFYPAEIEAIKTMHLEFLNFLENMNIKDTVHREFFYLNIIVIFSLFIFYALITFVSFSYAGSKKFIKFVYILVFPSFLILVISSFFITGKITFFTWPDAHFWRGAGLESAQQVFLLHSNIAQDSGSFFLMRFIEFGFVGAYLFYCFLLPPVYVFFNTLTVRRRRIISASIGLIVVCLLVVADLFWIYKPSLNALFLAGWVVIAVSWAHSGYKSTQIKR